MPKRFPDRVIVRFPAGMLARVDAVLKPGEDRGAFILAATAAALRKVEQREGRPLVGERPEFHGRNQQQGCPQEKGVRPTPAGR